MTPFRPFNHTIDLSDLWESVRKEEATVSWFLKKVVEHLEELNEDYFGRQIHHFKQLMKDRRFHQVPLSASGQAKFDSIWDHFLDWCEPRNITIIREKK